MQDGSPLLITDEKVKEVMQTKQIVYDKAGEEHYNIISAFIKSMRGSDPNAAVYYLARYSVQPYIHFEPLPYNSIL
jgi:putative ATPase